MQLLEVPAHPFQVSRLPLKRVTAKDTANVVTEQILTDRGSNFISETLQKVFRLLGATHIKTSPYHPQSNDCLECFHHTLLLSFEFFF